MADDSKALILVEVTTLNGEHNYPDVLWLLQEDDFLRYRQSRMLTMYYGRGEHLIDNHHLRLLRGQRESLSHRIYLHRFRKLLHQGLDLIRKFLIHQVVAISSLPTRTSLPSTKPRWTGQPRKNQYFKPDYMRWLYMQISNSTPWNVLPNRK